MRFSRRSVLGLATGILLAAVASPVLAAGSTVNVELWDKGAEAMGSLGTGPVEGYDSGADLSNAIMGISIDRTSVPAGDVTFEVTNGSKDIVHEMVVAPVPPGGGPLPYDKNDMRVLEEEAGHLGEVAELDPGRSGALRVTLKPGKYILYCDQPGHYAAGMWALLTVTG